MKRIVTVVETTTYYITVDVPPDSEYHDASYDAIEAAQDEWEANPSRKPDDYDVSFTVRDDV